MTKVFIYIYDGKVVVEGERFRKTSVEDLEKIQNELIKEGYNLNSKVECKTLIKYTYTK